MIVFCPTGIVATLIDGGTAFHRTFKVKTKDVTPEMIRHVFTIDVELTIIDEAPMIPSNFIAIMDRKLRQTYDATKMFGGKDMLLSGDFLQMKDFGAAI